MFWLAATTVFSFGLSSLIRDAALAARLIGRNVRGPSHLKLKKGNSVHERATGPGYLPHGSAASDNTREEERICGHVGY